MSSSFRRAGPGGGRAPTASVFRPAVVNSATATTTSLAPSSTSVPPAAATNHHPSPLSSFSAVNAAAGLGRPLRPPRGSVPSSSGRYLTSSGHRELDSILGGGQPLGTAILIEEDRWTLDLGRCLVRYWCAESVSQGQTLLLAATKPDPPDSLPSGPPPLDDDFCDSPEAGSNGGDSSGGRGGSSPSELRELVGSLPRDLNVDRAQRKVAEASGATASPTAATTNTGGSNAAEGDHSDEEDAIPARRGLGSLAEGDDEEDDDGGGDTEAGLKNAWQYRKSVQEKRSGASAARRRKAGGAGSAAAAFCHSYDLGARMADQRPEGWPWFDDEAPAEAGMVVIEDCVVAEKSSRRAGFALFKRLLRSIQVQLAKEDGTVVRLLLLDAPVGPTALALPLLLSYVRSHSLPVAILSTVRAWRCDSSTDDFSAREHLVALRRSSDAILACDSFAALERAHPHSEPGQPPPEFRDLAGLLSLPKMALFAGSAGHFADTTLTKRPPADRYGLRRDRRKLNARMLHLPPEEFSAGGTSVSGGGARSGGGKQTEKARPEKASAGCGGGAGASTALDF